MLYTLNYKLIKPVVDTTDESQNLHFFKRQSVSFLKTQVRLQSGGKRTLEFLKR